MSKKIFITGSSSGIGFEIATKLVNENHKVVLNGRNEVNLKKAKNDLSAFDYVCGDFSCLDNIDKYIETASTILGGLDVLICNVGSGKSVPPGSQDISEWKRVMDLNFFSATTSIESAKKYLNKNANIICISSICGLEIIPNAPLTYSVAKAALNAYVKGASKYLSKEGIRINAIAPGNIIFEESSWNDKLKDNPSSIKKMLKENVPLNRFGTPKEISELTSFLISENASFITGSIFSIDGGQTSNI